MAKILDEKAHKAIRKIVKRKLRLMTKVIVEENRKKSIEKNLKGGVT